MLTVVRVTQAVLLLDAMYHAMGISSFDLYDHVNFNSWFTTRLGPLLEVHTARKR